MVDNYCTWPDLSCIGWDLSYVLNCIRMEVDSQTLTSRDVVFKPPDHENVMTSFIVSQCVGGSRPRQPPNFECLQVLGLVFTVHVFHVNNSNLVCWQVVPVILSRIGVYRQPHFLCVVRFSKGILLVHGLCPVFLCSVFICICDLRVRVGFVRLLVEWIF